MFYSIEFDCVNWWNLFSMTWTHIIVDKYFNVLKEFILKETLAFLEYN